MAINLDKETFKSRILTILSLMSFNSLFYETLFTSCHHGR